MSMYLILEDKDCIWFGGDSALSHTVGGKTLRDPYTQVEKVFCHAGGVFACGGSLWDALQIRHYIESLSTVNEEVLSDISKALGQISAYSRTHGYSDESVTTVLMCCLLDTGRVYGMSICFGLEISGSSKENRLKDIWSVLTRFDLRNALAWYMIILC